jgi:hypothetical protein
MLCRAAQNRRGAFVLRIITGRHGDRTLGICGARWAAPICESLIERERKMNV